MTDWERNFRGNGIAFVLSFIIAAVVYGVPPRLGASAQTLAAFYDGRSGRIFAAGVILGFAILCLMWFAAALAGAMREADNGCTRASSARSS